MHVWDRWSCGSTTRLWYRGERSCTKVFAVVEAAPWRRLLMTVSSNLCELEGVPQTIPLCVCLNCSPCGDRPGSTVHVVIASWHSCMNMTSAGQGKAEAGLICLCLPMTASQLSSTLLSSAYAAEVCSLDSAFIIKSSLANLTVVHSHTADRRRGERG